MKNRIVYLLRDFRYPTETKLLCRETCKIKLKVKQMLANDTRNSVKQDERHRNWRNQLIQHRYFEVFKVVWSLETISSFIFKSILDTHTHTYINALPLTAGEKKKSGCVLQLFCFRAFHFIQIKFGTLQVSMEFEYIAITNGT